MGPLRSLLLSLIGAIFLLAGPRDGLAQISEREVSIDGLAASYTRPAHRERAPHAVIVAGSGPTDRNGNNAHGLNTNCYQFLAQSLAIADIASVRYDKRGVGGSAGIAIPEELLTIETFVQDAIAVASWASGQANGGSLILIGHSEGGLISMLAAQRAKAKAIVLLTTAGRPIAAALREQFSRPGLPEALAREAMDIIAALEQGSGVPQVSAELAPAFRPSVQPYLRSLMRIDPPQQLRQLSLPALVVGGGRDVQISRLDFDMLVAARADIEAYWDPSMGHVLKTVGSENGALERSYIDPNIVLAPDLSERIAMFVDAVSRR